MSLVEKLAVLEATAKKHNLHTPYICGGIVRDLMFAQEDEKGKRIEELNDVDITTGYDDVHLLADLFAGALGADVKEFDDGHKQVFHDGVFFDFSTNFKYKNVDELLKKAGVEEINDLVRETYSRDFTINAMLMPLDFSEVLDLTNKGMEDIRNKVLRCPLDCDASFKESPNRIMRCFVYIARFGMTMSEGVKRSIKSNLDLLTKINPRYAGQKLNEALRLQPDLLDDLIEMGVMGKLKLTKHVSRMLINKRRLLDVLK